MLAFLVCIIWCAASIAAVGSFAIGRAIGYDAGWDAHCRHDHLEQAEAERASQSYRVLDGHHLN